jgi:hypothetical protein
MMLAHHRFSTAARLAANTASNARFSSALASYQPAISSIVRRQPRHCRVRGSMMHIPIQGEIGVGSVI